jgi:predicted DsbA family dithiol-disulfide isomerase
MVAEQSPLPLQVDIVSDVVCPWCIIGYQQLQKALAEMPGQFAVNLNWQPFELNPSMPEEGQDLREHIAEKYGTSPQQSQAARERLTSLGQSLGFSFDYFDGMRMVNTFRAHQLLHWARAEGLQTELKLALFEAFFSRREDVNDIATLVQIADRVGLPQQGAREVLESGRHAAEVRSEQEQWREREVYAVPAFFFNDKYMIPGAQEAQTFVRVLGKIRAKELAVGSV